jgi:UDP-3-O-[3-hydroxymyristoyl] glucosamine N-acyltransferase
MLGGQVGVIDHLKIGEGVQVSAGACVFSDIPAGERWGGYPAMPLREWARSNVMLRRLARRPTASEGAKE